MSLPNNTLVNAMSQSTIVNTLRPHVIAATASRGRKGGIVIPTFSPIPVTVETALRKVGLGDINPLNLFRITWKNDINTGMFGKGNRFEVPRAITGVKARIIGLVGSYFPTGAHKVGAAFGCLVPRLVSGEFDPATQKAVWP